MAETTSGKSRTPKCARCRNHGYTVNLRGHKGFCPHITCTCNLCDLVKERQEVSKRQIKLRRRQQQEEVMGMYVPVPPSVFSRGSICKSEERKERQRRGWGWEEGERRAETEWTGEGEVDEKKRGRNMREILRARVCVCVRACVCVCVC